MNVRVAKEEMALMMPTTLSRFAPAGEHDGQAARTGTLFARIGAFARYLMELPSRRAVIDELSTLTDRELADIGLTRDSLSDVFSPDFASARVQDSRRGQFSRGYAA